MLSIPDGRDPAHTTEHNDRPGRQYDTYRRLYELGFNLVPKRLDDPKAAAKPWKVWQTERMPQQVFDEYLGFAQEHHVNMGIVTGEMPWNDFGIVALDPDDVEALEVVQRLCPDTFAKTITGNCQHLLYRHPRRGHISNPSGLEIDGTDYNICIKGDGGMVTAPGSLHETGRLYCEVIPWTKELLLATPVFDERWLPLPERESDEWDEEPEVGHQRHITRLDLIPMEERYTLACAHLAERGGTTEGRRTASKKCYRLAIDVLWKYALSLELAVRAMREWGQRDDQRGEHDQWKPWTERDIRHKLSDALKEYREHADEIIDWGAKYAAIETIIEPFPDDLLPKDEPVGGMSGASDHDEGVPDEKQSQRKLTQTQLLVMLATNRATFFHTPEEIGYGTLPVDDHEENWPVRSARFRRWLTSEFWDRKRDAPNDKAMKAALDILEHRAIQSASQSVHLRVARAKGNIYIDLGRDDWRVVEVSRDGWRTLDHSPVKFRRTKNTGQLPLPTHGGSLDELRPLAATTPENWPLIIGWLLDAMKGHGPYMVLVVTGEQGSAKSSLCRLLRAFGDPLKMAPLASLPRDEKDLGVDGANEHLLMYDNVSYLPQWLSDCLCRVSTGGGIKSRMLYTDGEQSIFDICRPVCLNGIPDFAESNDLLGRSLIISQPSIPNEKRLDEQTLALRFEQVKPGVFGALLDALSQGVKHWDTTKVIGLPRMADSARWITACLGDDSFLTQYRRNAETAVDLGLEASPIAGPIRKFLAEGKSGFLPGHWEGTATELLTELDKRSDMQQFTQKTYPKNARALSNRLRRDAPALRAVGIQVEFAKSGSARHITFAPVRDS